MGDGSRKFDPRERWADYPWIHHPKGWRLLRFVVFVYAIAGVPGVFVIAFFTEPVGEIFLLICIGWAAILLPLVFTLHRWTGQIDRLEHQRLLRIWGTGKSTIVGDVDSERRGGLLAPERSNYVMKSSWPWVGNIYDEDGRTIGRRVTSPGPGGTMHSVHEIDGPPTLLIQAAVSYQERPPKDTYDVRDGDGHSLGMIKWRKQGWRGPEVREGIILVGPHVPGSAADDDESLRTLPTYEHGDLNHEFVIRDTKSRQPVAEFRKYDVPPTSPRTLRDRIKNGSVFSLHVLDQSYDRRTLLGLTVLYFDRLRKAGSGDGD